MELKKILHPASCVYSWRSQIRHFSSSFELENPIVAVIETNAN